MNLHNINKIIVALFLVGAFYVTSLLPEKPPFVFILKIFSYAATAGLALLLIEEIVVEVITYIRSRE